MAEGSLRAVAEFLRQQAGSQRFTQSLCHVIDGARDSAGGPCEVQRLAVVHSFPHEHSRKDAGHDKQRKSRHGGKLLPKRSRQAGPKRDSLQRRTQPQNPQRHAEYNGSVLF